MGLHPNRLKLDTKKKKIVQHISMARGSKMRRKHLSTAMWACSGRSNHGALLNPTVIVVDNSNDGHAEISEDEVCSCSCKYTSHRCVPKTLAHQFNS